MTVSELERKVNNLIQYGTITEVNKSGSADHSPYALAVKVSVMGRTTSFIPVASLMSPFKRHYIPPRVGEQVILLCPFGDADNCIALRGIPKDGDEPITGTSVDEETEYIEYEDGTKIEVNLEEKKIKIDTPMDIELKCKSWQVIQGG